MSTVKFIEHDGRRVLVDEQKITTEMRCDLCGEFIDRDDAMQVQVRMIGVGVTRAPLLADAHPSCAERAIDHLLTGPVT